MFFLPVVGMLLVIGDGMDHGISSLPDSLPKICGSDGHTYNNHDEMEIMRHITRSEGKQSFNKYLAVPSQSNEYRMYLMFPYNACNV
jgi:hypothetical protein